LTILLVDKISRFLHDKRQIFVSRFYWQNRLTLSIVRHPVNLAVYGDGPWRILCRWEQRGTAASEHQLRVKYCHHHHCNHHCCQWMRSHWQNRCHALSKEFQHHEPTQQHHHTSTLHYRNKKSELMLMRRATASANIARRLPWSISSIFQRKFILSVRCRLK